jgi:hypothetical protein
MYYSQQAVLQECKTNTQSQRFTCTLAKLLDVMGKFKKTRRSAKAKGLTTQSDRK